MRYNFFFQGFCKENYAVSINFPGNGVKSYGKLKSVLQRWQISDDGLLGTANKSKIDAANFNWKQFKTCFHHIYSCLNILSISTIENVLFFIHTVKKITWWTYIYAFLCKIDKCIYFCSFENYMNLGTHWWICQQMHKCIHFTIYKFTH